MNIITMTHAINSNTNLLYIDITGMHTQMRKSPRGGKESDKKMRRDREYKKQKKEKRNKIKENLKKKEKKRKKSINKLKINKIKMKK